MKLCVLAVLLVFHAGACGGNPPKPVPPKPTLILVNVDDEGLALEGWDPVTFHDGAPTPGNLDRTSVHDKATYRFSSAQTQRRFEAAPEKYAPRYGGYCAYAVSQNRLSTVQIDQYEIYEDHLLMFTNADYKQRFDAAKAETFKKAEATWPDLLAKHGKAP